MLMAHPTVLADLLDRYETLRARHGQENDAQLLQRLNDVSYTLCVATGTRDVAAALTVARDQLQGARAESHPVGADA
ncbi:DUF5133 domain-containing protein [Streptomyces sp. SID12501]|uniref:DUF5133 domain-containing protein n=1 Tax=Streptomyces sp. SID12501 TaxID=2706042 RepID=A0A6B3BTD4_9ACTN|nr:DUF5133 domain-containing protein [Streptomyces sp. SID12501]NEC87560.1 DUF5133 domain-containing protein [Streptomyces sp. SID12501]